MPRVTVILFALLVAAGCTDNRSLDGTPTEDLGAFRLGHNVVVASKMQQVIISRNATEEEWVTALTAAIDDRFSRYEGSDLFHFGVSVEGFSLAPPGIPVIAAPKSVLFINVTVWDDAAGKKINEKPHQILVFESLTGGSIVGTGYTQSREEQLAGLAFNAAYRIEAWLAEQHAENNWFAADATQGDEVSDEPEAPEQVQDAVDDLVTGLRDQS